VKHLKSFLYLIVLAGVCMAQTKHVTDSATVNLCWTPNPDTSAVYFVYYRNYTGDTTWWNIGSTKMANFSVIKATKKVVVFGVRTYLPAAADTSDLHTSLDSTACNASTSCSSCSLQGPWYLQWKVKKPTSLTDKR
jgi:hypothetical protein